MTDTPAPSTVRLCARYIDGLIAAGWDRDVARETVEASVTTALEATQRDPIGQLGHYLDDEGLRERLRDCTQAYESGLTFDNVTAYFAGDSDVPSSVQADIQDALLDAIIVGCMEDRGISAY